MEDSICRAARANGRVATTRSWARRSLDAATIFIAFVICCVFFTARMRRRMSISEGIVYAFAATGAAGENFLPYSSSADFSFALRSSSMIFFSTISVSRL